MTFEEFFTNEWVVGNNNNIGLNVSLREAKENDKFCINANDLMLLRKKCNNHNHNLDDHKKVVKNL